jgi:hypothetical protein
MVYPTLLAPYKSMGTGAVMSSGTSGRRRAERHPSPCRSAVQLQWRGGSVGLAGHRQGVLPASVGQLGGGDPVQQVGPRNLGGVTRRGTLATPREGELGSGPAGSWWPPGRTEPGR